MEKSCQDNTSWQLSMPNESMWYDVFQTFGDTYDPVHGYISVVICPLGILLNVFNIVVLTQPGMRSTVNALLTAIALCDTVVMSSNLVFVSHYSLLAGSRCVLSDYSFAWAVYALGHAHCSLIGHTTSSWLSVAMALIRYTTIYGAQQGRPSRVGPREAAMLSVVILLCVAACAIPGMSSYTIGAEQPYDVSYACYFEILTYNSLEGIPYTNESQDSLVYVPQSVGASGINCLILQLSFWISGILFKAIPCFLLTIFIGLLVSILTSVRNRRHRLKNFSSLAAASQNGNGGRQADNNDTDGCDDRKDHPRDALTGKDGGATVSKQQSFVKSDRTTKMLIAVLAIFLITELPQGILLVMNGIFDQTFRTRVYNKLGNFSDLLSLINSSTNFIILCTMSKRFRQTFIQIFVPIPIYNKLSQSEPTLRFQEQSVFIRKLSRSIVRQQRTTAPDTLGVLVDTKQ